MRHRSFILLFFLLFSMIPPAALGQTLVIRAGDLDVRFGGGDGLVASNFGGHDDGSALLRQSDGKLIVLGTSTNNGYRLLVARYTADGQLDPSFSGDGFLTDQVSSANTRGYAGLLTSSGKIVVVGDVENSATTAIDYKFALAQYTATGAADTSFGSAGKLSTAIGDNAQAFAAALAPNGKIVVAGLRRSGSNSDFAVARYNTNGTLDTTFSSDGIQIVDFGSPYDEAYAVAVQSDGKIVLAGKTGSGSSTNIALARLNSNGALDTTFSGDGRLTKDVNGNTDVVRGVTVLSSGHILVAGSTLDGSRYQFALLKYTSSGQLVTSFGSNGVATAAFNNSALANGLIEQPDGSTILFGKHYPHTAVARFDPTGQRDQSFGSDGMVTIEHGTASNASSGVLDADGNIVLAGITGAYPMDVGLIRLYGAPIFNQGPVAVADSFQFLADTPRNERSGVLVNDTDADNHELTAVLEQDVAHGSLVLQPQGTFIYTPTAGFIGSDQFSYRAFDGFDYSAPVTATLEIVTENSPPVVTISSPVENAYFAAHELTVTGSVTDSEGFVQNVLVNDTPATVTGTLFSANITLGEGAQIIVVTALDAQGSASSASRIVSVDTVGPQVTVVTPAQGQAVYTLTPTVRLDYVDTVSAVDPASIAGVFTSASGATTALSLLSADADGALGQPATPLAVDTVYTLTLQVADTLGHTTATSATFYVTPDPAGVVPPVELPTSGWINGIVADTSTCDAELVTCQGLAGARITLEQRYSGETATVIGTVLTGPDGFFAFPVERNGIYWVRIEKDGYTYGQREIATAEERTATSNTIYLTPLDSAAVTCDIAGCDYTNSDGSISVDIPPGAITAGVSETIRATNFEQVEFLPSGELPPGTWETYAFNLSGDSELTFAKPVTVTLRNDRAFPPGTEVPMGYWNQATQQWEHTGTAVVDASGDYLVGQVVHFSNYDWNFPVSPAGFSFDIDVDDDDASSTCAGEEGCWVNYKSGALEEWVTVPGVQVLDTNVAPELRYNSKRANPAAIIDVNLRISQIGNAQLGDHVMMEVFIEGQKTDVEYFSLLDSPDEAGRFRYEWDGRNARGEPLPPGIYNYTVKIGVPYEAAYCRPVGGRFGNACDAEIPGYRTLAYKYETVHGTIALDVDTDLANGWVLDGQQRLYHNALGQVLISDGRERDTFSEVGVSGAGFAALSIPPERPVLQPSVDAVKSVADTAVQLPELTPPALLAPDDADSTTVAKQESYTQDVGIASVNVCGTIDSAQTWTAANSPYVVTCSIVVTSTGSLTIEPGTEVRFNSGLLSFNVLGTLNAQGTPTQPITFTPNVLTPTAQFWRGIELLEGHQTAALSHIVVEYAQNNLVVTQSAASPALTITDSIFRSAQNGLHVTVKGSPLPVTLERLSFTNHTFLPMHLVLQEASGLVRTRALSFTANPINALTFAGVDNLFDRNQTTISGEFTLDSEPGQAVVLADHANGACGSFPIITATGRLRLVPGAILKHHTFCRFHVEGELIAEGTADAPIIFTSLKDDAHGGDSQNDGPTSGAPGQWNGLYLTQPRKVRLVHTQLLFFDALQVDTQNALSPFSLELEHTEVLTGRNGLLINSLGRNTDVTIRDSLFADQTFNGMNLNLTSGGAVIRLEQNHFANNGAAALRFFLNNANAEVIARGNTASGNTTNGAELPAGVIGGSLIFDWGGNPEFPLVLVSTVPVGVTASMWIGPGTIIKSATGKLDVAGTLTADGTPTEPIIFTHIDDDSVGGDTRGNGPPTAALNPWPGLELRGTRTTLDHVTIKHANDAILLRTDDVSISASRFISNVHGIHVRSNEAFAPQTLQGNTFVGNTAFGIKNEGTATINARDNWWGAASGPRHATNPAGTGDVVSNGVFFDPWLASPDGFFVTKDADDYSSLRFNLEANVYTRTYPDGTQVVFNIDGTHRHTLKPDGRKIAYTYNNDGSVATIEITAPGQFDPQWVWRFGYVNQHLASITDPAGRITAVEIDDLGDLRSVVFPDQSMRSFVYDDEHLLIAQTDQNGATTRYEYVRGRIQRIQDPARPVFDPETGTTKIEIPIRDLRVQDNNPPPIEMAVVGTFSSVGGRSSPSSPRPPAPKSREVKATIHAIGSGARIEGEFNKSGSWKTKTDALSRTTTFERDSADRITRYTEPDGDCTLFVYDFRGNVQVETHMPAEQCAIQNPAERDPAKVIIKRATYESRFNQIKTLTDGRGNITTFVYDYEDNLGDAGKLVRIVYAAVADETGQMVNPTVRYTYNALGLLESVTDPRGSSTRYVYTSGSLDEAADGATPRFKPGVDPVPGLLTQIIRDEGGAALTTIFGDFDAVGHPGTVIGPDGKNAMTYVYDALGRVTSITDALGRVTAFEYDAKGNRTAVIRDQTDDDSGRNVRTTFTYNADDQIINSLTVADGLVVRNRWLYNDDRILSATEDGLGQRTVYRYNAANQIQSITDAASQVTTFAYAQDGRLHSITDAENSSTVYRYDGFGRVEQVIVNSGVVTASETLTTTYAYDADNNVVRVTDPAGFTTGYAYDALSRVLTATQNISRSQDSLGPG